MYITPDIVVTTVNKFISDEIHIIGKQSKNPSATLSFVPIDKDGARLASAPVAIVNLTGEAFNIWYEAWDNESMLYSTLLDLLKNQTPGISLTGVDLSKLNSLTDIKVENAEEILAKI